MAIIMLASSTRLSNKRDAHLLNNDMCGLSQTRTVGAIECSLVRANRRPTGEAVTIAQWCSIYRHGVLIKAYITRVRCQFRRGRSIVSDGRSDDDVGLLQIYVAARRGFRRKSAWPDGGEGSPAKIANDGSKWTALSVRES